MDTKQEADMGVTKESFGFLEDKREAFLYTIENQNGFAVKVTDFGVNIVSLLVKNKEGNIKDVALGYDTLEEYFENGIMFGATVGRNVNRISNARFEMNDRTGPCRTRQHFIQKIVENITFTVTKNMDFTKSYGIVRSLMIMQ
mgnify:CR=1 FL=1